MASAILGPVPDQPSTVAHQTRRGAVLRRLRRSHVVVLGDLLLDAVLEPERPPDCIATHGADEPCSRAQTRKPARGRRRGSALPEANLAGNVGRPRERALGFEDGVEQQVAEDHDV